MVATAHFKFDTFFVKNYKGLNMEFIHIDKKTIRIFVGSLERQKQIEEVIRKFAEVIRMIQKELK